VQHDVACMLRCIGQQARWLSELMVPSPCRGMRLLQRELNGSAPPGTPWWLCHQRPPASPLFLSNRTLLSRGNLLVISAAGFRKGPFHARAAQSVKPPKSPALYTTSRTSPENPVLNQPTGEFLGIISGVTATYVNIKVSHGRSRSPLQ